MMIRGTHNVICEFDDARSCGSEGLISRLHLQAAAELLNILLQKQGHRCHQCSKSSSRKSLLFREAIRDYVRGSLSTC